MIVDGKFPKKAADIFLAHGVTHPHDYSGAITTADKIGQYDKNFGYRCQEQACVYCARPMVVSGSVTFWGRNKKKGDSFRHENRARINGSTDERLLHTVALLARRSHDPLHATRLPTSLAQLRRRLRARGRRAPLLGPNSTDASA